MTNSGHKEIGFGLAKMAVALLAAVAASACTPATADSQSAGSGGGQAVNSSGGSPVASVGTGGAPALGSGGSPASVGTGGAEVSSGGSPGTVDSGGTGGKTGGVPIGSGGATPGGSGGSPSGSGGTTGGATGGTTGTSPGGASGAVGGAIGCNWVQSPDGTWAFGTPAAADKIVLFDGTTKNGWHKLNMPGVPIDWDLLPDGTLKVVPSGTGQATLIQTDKTFSDLCVHVEYLTPVFKSGVDVQQQGNSGVYLKSAYEMQILDTHNLGPLIDGCGAVYQVQAPLVVACNMYGVWNTYEIEFKGSLWSGTTKTKDAEFVKVTLNGKLVQMNVDLMVNVTKAGIIGGDTPGPMPLGLQDHLDTVSFRNIWATVPRY